MKLFPLLAVGLLTITTPAMAGDQVTQEILDKCEASVELVGGGQPEFTTCIRTMMNNN